MLNMNVKEFGNLVLHLDENLKREEYLIWEGSAAYIHESSMHVEVNRKGKNIYKGLREEEKGPAKAPHAGVLISGRH